MKKELKAAAGWLLFSIAVTLVGMAVVVGAHAEGLLEQVKKLEPEKQCFVLAGLFQAGIVAHNYDAPLLFLNKDPTSSGECEGKPEDFKNGIHICRFEAMSAEDKTFIMDGIKDGWVYADEGIKLIVKQGGDKDKVEIDPKDANQYYHECLQHIPGKGEQG